MKTSDRGRGPSTKGSVSGQKACGAPGDLKSSSEHLSVVGALSEEPDQPEQTSGHLTSPNFPGNYPNGLHERKTIEVAKGNVIKIHFTDFDLERPDQVDYVDILDGDGSFLGRFGARHYLDEEGSGEGLVEVQYGLGLVRQLSVKFEVFFSQKVPPHVVKVVSDRSKDVD